MSAFIDLTGKRFGRWTVIALLGRIKKQTVWKCRCECGNVVDVLGISLKFGRSHSCGCLQRELVSKRFSTHGRAHCAEYNTWAGMKARCSNPNDKRYQNYGGRGITVCSRWEKSFTAFWEDLGPKPTAKHSIDRIDNNGNYTPSNCRWATNQEQCNNKRTNTLLTLNGRTLNIAQWTKELGFANDAVIVKRIIRGWPIEKVLTIPLNGRLKEKVNAHAKA